MKGQAALEFLMTYGWALIAVLAMIGTIAYFGLFNSAVLPNKCTVSPPFACMDHKVTSDGIVLVSVMNGGSDIAYTNFTLFCNQDTAQWRSYIKPTILGGQQRLNGSLLYFSCPVTSSMFRGNIEVQYRYLGDTVSHTLSGEIRSAVVDP